MSDSDLRNLERQAHTGDPEALSQLVRSLERAGDQAAPGTNGTITLSLRGTEARIDP